jgi:mono/diheme cytochrome c family protein
MRRLLTASLLVGALVLGGCRGMKSEDPPIHPNMNMDIQNRFDPQEANPLFADNAAMRKPPSGTVARGLLRADSRYYAGRTEEGEYVEQMPVPVNRALLERGQERYEIFCTVCHGAAGDGNGIIMTGQSNVTGQGYGYTPAPTYHSERLREETDGYIYDVVANGVRNMPGYAQQIPVADRWAIVAYVRALQRSQNADAADVPQSVISDAQPSSSASNASSSTGDN